MARKQMRLVWLEHRGQGAARGLSWSQGRPGLRAAHSVRRARAAVNEGASAPWDVGSRASEITGQK